MAVTVFDAELGCVLLMLAWSLDCFLGAFRVVGWSGAAINCVFCPYAAVLKLDFLYMLRASQPVDKPTQSLTTCL